MPRVSILIPCYNAERWVAQAIQSALAQTYPDKEVIVVDDGSTDGSLDVIKSFGDQIRWETGPNRGGNVARNRLLELSNGEWLQYLDADDYLLPEKIEVQLREIDNIQACDVAYSPVIVERFRELALLQQHPLLIPPPYDPWTLLIYWRLPQTGAALWRRTSLEGVGGWKVDQPCCQEHELYLRLLTRQMRFSFCPTPLAVYRIWSTSTVCHKHPFLTLTHRRTIVDAAEQYLQNRDCLTLARRDAIAYARYECARSVYQFDRPLAERIAACARQSHPRYKLPLAPCFSRSYRFVFHLAGFRAAERVAAIARPLKTFKVSS